MNRRIAIELTNHCNLSCPACARHHVSMELGFMTGSLFARIIGQLEPGTTVFPFWRGESLLHPFFDELMNVALNRGVNLVLATNGLLIEEDRSILTKFGAVSVSLHNTRSLRGLRKLIAMRGSATKPEITATMIKGEETGVDFKGIEADVDKIRLYTEHTIGGIWGKTATAPTQRRKWCVRLDTDLLIGWDGSVSRCCYVWRDPELCNLNANDLTLEQIIVTAKKLRDTYPDEVCGACDQWQGNGKSL